MGKIIYWERYRGDTRPAPLAAWVFDDGTDDSGHYIHSYATMSRCLAFSKARPLSLWPATRAELPLLSQNVMRYFDSGRRTLPR